MSEATLDLIKDVNAFNLVHFAGTNYRYYQLFVFCAISDASFFPENFKNCHSLRSHLEEKARNIPKCFSDFTLSFSNRILQVSFEKRAALKEEAIEELNQMIVFLAESIEALENLQNRTQMSIKLNYKDLNKKMEFSSSSAFELMKFIMSEKRSVAVTSPNCSEEMKIAV